MKFVSLFNKTPHHKKFTYVPRFYDEKAEERKEREKRILREIEGENGNLTPGANDYQGRIAGSLQAARKRSRKGKVELNAVLLRSGLLLFLTLFAIAYLTWGSDVVYSLLVFIPLYFYLKLRR